MGGSLYDREIETVTPIPSTSPSATATISYSTKADSIFQQNRTMDPQLTPKNRNLETTAKNPIVCAIDVTGSMGNWAKTIWDKLPMFFGQLVSQSYLTEPSISFAGVGDSNTDQAPLQVAEFRQGTALDTELQRLWLEGGGGGQHYESYELCAYYYTRHCHTPHLRVGFFFFMGDEGFYPKIKSEHIFRIIGDGISEDVNSEMVFSDLRNRFHVFFIHKPYWDKEIDKKQLLKWKAVVGEDRILELKDPKAIVDIMLGAIAIVGRTRTLEQYINDLEERGQTSERIADVNRCLQVVSDRLDHPALPPPGAGVDLVSTTTTTTTITTAEPVWPPEYKCPITEEPLVDPVIARDGHTYERAAIQGWLEENGMSPITGEAIPLELIPNVTLRNTIAQFRAKHGF